MGRAREQGHASPCAMGPSLARACCTHPRSPPQTPRRTARGPGSRGFGRSSVLPAAAPLNIVGALQQQIGGVVPTNGLEATDFSDHIFITISKTCEGSDSVGMADGACRQSLPSPDLVLAGFGDVE